MKRIRMRVFNFGRFSVGLYSWMGFSRRYVKGLGQVLDLGFVKVVW